MNCRLKPVALAPSRRPFGALNVRQLSRVVWTEGMYLAQHHFQAQSRWFEDLAAFSLSGVHFRPYGLIAAQLDDEALLNGTVSMVHGRGVLPDGMPFDFPIEDPPPPIEIGDIFAPTRDTHRVLLSLPAYRDGRSNCVLNGDSPEGVRYRAEERELPDETTGTDPLRIPLARRNFRLVLEGLENSDYPSAGDSTSLPIARIRRDGRGHFVYDRDFIPPALHIAASPRLVEILGRLVEVLSEKAAAMSAQRAASAQDLAEHAAREVASFWLSHTIHSAVAPLRHLMVARSVHPERVYLELSRLAGSLCTFALDAHPTDLPHYDHDEPGATFDALDRHIRRHLDVAIPTGHRRLKLVPAEPHRKSEKDEILVPADGADDSAFRIAVVEDSRSVGRGVEWYLGIRSTRGTGDLIAGVPRLVKICAGRYLVRIVKEAYPGLGLEHVPSPPAALAPRLGTTYFRILRTEPCWQAIADTKEVGLYIPSAIPDPEPELVVVSEG